MEIILNVIYENVQLENKVERKEIRNCLKQFV